MYTVFNSVIGVSLKLIPLETSSRISKLFHDQTTRNVSFTVRLNRTSKYDLRILSLPSLDKNRDF